MSRESGTLEKLAEMTRGKSEAKTGSTAKNTNNFVFAAVSPPPKSGNYKNNEQAAETTGAENQNQGKKNKSKSNKNHQAGPAQKRARVDRTLTEENGSSTIFGLLD